jgi:hypothetical protein
MFWAAYQRLRPPALDGLVQQYETYGYPGTRLYAPDFAVPHRRIAIEIDGHEFHSDPEVFVNDRVRQRSLEMAGWRFIRFAGREAKNDPDRCVREAAELAVVLVAPNSPQQPSVLSRLVACIPPVRQTLSLVVGDLVSHTKYGVGVVIATDGVGARANATMDFTDYGLVRLMLIGSVPLTKLEPGS